MRSVLNKGWKNLLSVIIVFSITLSCISPVAFAAKDEPWEINYDLSGEVVPFAPEDGYVSIQNPPSFKWTQANGEPDGYELVVAKDAGLNNIVYQTKTDINYIVPEVKLETGIPLYWSVRFIKGKKISTWSQARRFRIDPDAYEMPVLPIDEIMARIDLTAHPRIFTTAEDLENFRSYKDKSETSKKAYDAIMHNARILTEKGIIDKDRPVKLKDEFPTEAEFFQHEIEKYDYAKANMDRAYDCAFAYLISGDEKIGRYAADLVLEYSNNWDVNGYTAYAYNDMACREIMYKGALVYDWVYPLLTENDKKSILDMVKARFHQMEQNMENLARNPYNSHGVTASQMMTVTAVTVLGDIPEAKAWLERLLKMTTGNGMSWSYQDGGVAQGVGYGRYVKEFLHENMRVLQSVGIVDIYNNAHTRNEYFWWLYTDPAYGWGSFGDQGYYNRGSKTFGAPVREMMQAIYFMDDPEVNGIRKWIVEQSGGPNDNIISYVMGLKYDETESVPPTRYQLAHEYQDIGWINMSSDIMDSDSVLLTFKSSPWGSFNHSQSDQNSFFIQAYGEPLAITSGYYDSYGSDHHWEFARKTGAHNSVTVATNKGQSDASDMNADGHLTGYLTQIDFDLAKGDATVAYEGRLGKFERAIIYIRPDMFVVVDDLKAKEGIKSSFEWWLNAENEIKLYEEGNGARIQEEGAMLDATVQYPKSVKSYYNDIYALSDMVEHPPTVQFTDANVPTRVWFETDRVEETKMIVTLDVHRSNQEARYVDTEYFDNYVKMTFEDGTIMLVNLGESTEEVVTNDGISFRGQVVTYNDESIMLVGGTSLKQGDVELITLEKPGSVVMGRDELSISTYEDNRISINVNNNYVSEVTKITDYDGREISSAIGISYKNGKLVETQNNSKKDKTVVYTVEEAEDYLTFDCWKDNYQLMLNGKLITTELYDSYAKVKVDGEEQEVKLQGYERRDGKIVYNGKIVLDGNKYKVTEKSDDLIAGAFEVGTSGMIDEISISTENPENQYLSLEKVPVTELTVKTEKDYDAIKENLAAFIEAEDYVGKIAPGARVYTTRSFLSGGKGMSTFSTVGTQMKYEFEIKEEGDYNFVIKYVAWDENGARRQFELDGKDYSFTMERTIDFGSVPEYWRAAVGDGNIHLKPGKYTITFDVLEGNWNYDWFGFIKK